MDIQVGKALALLDELNAGESEKIGLGDLFVKAAANAAVAVPDVNASWLDGVVRQYQRVDVNLVVGVGEGLRAPVLIDVASMSLKDVAAASATAMEDESPYVAGTMTVQNLGAFGLSSAAPVVHTACARLSSRRALHNRSLSHRALALRSLLARPRAAPARRAARAATKETGGGGRRGVWGRRQRRGAPRHRIAAAAAAAHGLARALRARSAR